MKTQKPDQVFDELLVLQYKAGDTKALTLLIKRWHKRITLYAFRNTRNMEASKDITQDVWIVAMQGLKRLKSNTKIGSWLLSITHNKSMDWLRQKEKDRQVEPVEHEPVGAHSQDERLQQMRLALKQLNTDHHNILSLFYLEGFTILEIMQILKLSKGTVKSRLFYARESLKKELKQ